MDFELLKQLYCVFSPSLREKKMRKFIKNWISVNAPSANVVQDGHGNLLITKGDTDSYPCLCAHMDQVQDLHPKDFTCVESDEVIFGYSPKVRHQCGLGADDKNGIFIALTCLEKYDNIKCAFFVGEEIGCIGSSAVDTTFFTDCRFCIQIDRRGNSDMVTSISYDQLCSSDFIRDANPEAWGYRESQGLMTDVDALRTGGVIASCINLSCGYYEPHTDREYTSKQDVEKCYNFVCHLIEDLNKSYPFDNYHDDYYEDVNHYIGQCAVEIFDILRENPNMTREDVIEFVIYNYPLTDEELNAAYTRACSYLGL